MNFLDVKTDFAFKKVFGSEESKDILIDFLNSVIFIVPMLQRGNYKNNESALGGAYGFMFVIVGVPLVGTRKSGCKQYVVSGFCTNLGQPQGIARTVLCLLS